MPAPKSSRLEPSAQQDAQPWRIRVHRRVIMRDVRKAIYDARSPIAILTGLLGGIKDE